MSDERHATTQGLELPPVDAVAVVAADALPAVLAHLAALQAAVAARLSAPESGTPHVTAGPPDDQLVTATEAAALLSVPKGYVAALGRRGELPRVAFGKYVRFRLADVRLWIARNREARR